MKVKVICIDNTFLPSFWWTNIATHAVSTGTWVDEEMLNDDHEYFEIEAIDPDHEAEIMMNNYERE